MDRARLAFVVVVHLLPCTAWPQGNPVGPEFRINTYTMNLQGGGSVAADASGNFVVVWTSKDQDGSGWGVFGQRYADSGIPLGPEFRVNTYTTSYQYMNTVAGDQAGNFVVVWASYAQDGSGFGVFGQRFGSTGTPAGSEFRVNTLTMANQFHPSVAAAPTGDFVIAWVGSYAVGGGYHVFGQRYAGSGTPLGSAFRINTYSSPGLAASVAADGLGNYIVCWSGGEVLGRRYAGSGAALGPEFRVNTYTTWPNLFPSVAADVVGNFVVVWNSSEQDGSEFGIFGRRFSGSGAPLGSEFRINTYTTNFQVLPSVGSDPAGNFVVTWASQAQDGSGYGVFSQRYDSSGTALGSEFRVNSSTTLGQYGPSVATAGAGSFIITWQGGNVSSLEVFGQRYDSIVPVELMHFRLE